MARLIVGNDAVFEAMRPVNFTAQLYDFVAEQQQRYHQAFGNVQNALTDKIHHWQQAFVATDAARVAGAIMRQAESYFNPEGFRYLTNMWDIQNAPSDMIRGLMAMPEARNLANKQMCNAYEGQYFDAFPAATPQEHRDYKLVYDGIIVDSEDDDIDYTMVLYGDDLVVDDPYQYLQAEQKYNVIEARSLMCKALAEDIDFTDPMNNKLR